MENVENILKESLFKYYNSVKKLRVAIIAGVEGKSTIYKDYSAHSIKSFLCDSSDIEYYLNILQNDGAYATAYFNFLDFIKDYLNNSQYISPNIIFETSPIPSVNKTREQIVPAFLDLLDIKHLGPNGSLNALCNNKYLWNRFFHAHNIPVPETHLFSGTEWVTLPNEGKQYILKLNYECTSIGITSNSIFENIKDMTDNARKLYVEYNQPVIAQEFICGHEVETPILANDGHAIPLPSIEIVLNDRLSLDERVLNYECRFNETYTMQRFDVDHPIESRAIEKCINRIAKLCQIDGYMRLDCRVDNKGRIYFFDFNNDPAINKNSSFYAALSSLGCKQDDVIRILIGNSLKWPLL